MLFLFFVCFALFCFNSHRKVRDETGGARESSVTSGVLCQPKAFPHLLAVAWNHYHKALLFTVGWGDATHMMAAWTVGGLDAAQSSGAATEINCSFVHGSPFLI